MCLAGVVVPEGHPASRICRYLQGKVVRRTPRHHARDELVVARDSGDRRPEKRTPKPGGEDGRVALQSPRKGLETSAIRLYVPEHLITS